MKILKTDKLECIDNNDCISGSLTQGKIYSTLNEYNSVTPTSIIYILDDTNQERGFFYKRFKKVEEMSEDFEVDVLNREIYKQVLNIAENNGFRIGGGMKSGYYQYLCICNNIVNGNMESKGIRQVSINDFCKMIAVKPIMIGEHKVVKTSTGIKVGCTNISMEQIEEIYKLAKS